MSFYRFGEGWQSTEGMRPKIEPLPFDDIEAPKSLLERIEERQLMSYQRLDNVGISASAVRKKIMLISKHAPQYEWGAWKYAVCEISGKSWEEIAPMIYEGLV